MFIFEGRNRVTQTYGGAHGGIDIVGDDDKSVRCVATGTVNLVQRWDGKTKTGSQSYGNLVRIKSGSGFFYYAHLDSVLVRTGQRVSAGEKLGDMGSTGNTTGPHVHFEIRRGKTAASARINPAPFCGVNNAKGVYWSGTVSALPQPRLFAGYEGSTVSIVDALKAIGADSSYNYRKKIAAANDIDNYRGLAEQNTKMLSMLRNGALKKP